LMVPYVWWSTTSTGQKTRIKETKILLLFLIMHQISRI
jgi:hypothetical protein